MAAIKQINETTVTLWGIYQHYERFDSQYKRLLPLRRVYVPEAIEGENE